jgi:hypothetical protein
MSLSQRHATLSAIIAGQSSDKDRKVSPSTTSLCYLRLRSGKPLNLSWKRGLSSLLDDPCNEGQDCEQDRIKRMKTCHTHLVQMYCDGLSAISHVKDVEEAPDVILPET